MAELPSGTVSLLFTDIEGSTQLRRQLGDAYQGVVENHRLLLEEAFAAHGGTVVGVPGLREVVPVQQFEHGLRRRLQEAASECLRHPAQTC
jgi:hypothetical protein